MEGKKRDGTTRSRRAREWKSRPGCLSPFFTLPLSVLLAASPGLSPGGLSPPFPAASSTFFGEENGSLPPSLPPPLPSLHPSSSLLRVSLPVPLLSAA